MTKFFKKPKKLIFGPYWALFAQIWAKINFPVKMASVIFEIFQLSTIWKKTEKNHWPIPEKNVELTHGQTDREIDNRQTDRQTT